MVDPRHIGVLLVGLILAGCAGTTIEQIQDQLLTGESGECRTRLRSLDTALRLYGTDYDDQFPPSDWNLTLAPYLQSHPESISCPGLHSDDNALSGYAINSALLGASFSTFPDLSLVVTFYETPDLIPGANGNPDSHLTTSRHSGSIFRVYADGYIENVGSTND